LIVENFCIAGVGYVRAEDRDAIPQAADFLLTEENVHTAIVYGIVTGDDREEELVGSLRTTKLTVDPDGFIKEALGKNAAGLYFGGGKLTAGGFEIPIGFLSAGPPGDEYRELKWRSYDHQIKHKLFTKIGVDHKPAAA
jgi:nanoRNase/pAp phosphatase (c-di-AMP/oligoRNAs hydrolase)